jgi:hypothetical protein
VEEAIKRWSEEFCHVVLHTLDIYTRRQSNQLKVYVSIMSNSCSSKSRGRVLEFQ